MRKNDRRRLRHIAEESARSATRDFNRARRHGEMELPEETEASLSDHALRVTFSKMTPA
jgi:hypothetical protein